MKSISQLRGVYHLPVLFLFLTLYPFFSVSAIKEDKFDPEYLLYLGTVQVVFSGVKTYISYEQKLPEKSEHLLKSPYLAVPVQDLQNPYTKKPMVFPPKPAFGDIAWVFQKGVLKLITTSRTRKNAPLQHSEMIYDKSIVDKWASEAISSGYGHDDFKFVMSLSHDDRWLYLSCFQVSFAMRNLPNNPYASDYPTTLKGINDDLRFRQFFIFSIWNPYEKRYAREVTEPSPGDFILKWVTTPRSKMPVLYCFNRVGEPLSPGLKQFFEAEGSLQRPRIPE